MTSPAEVQTSATPATRSLNSFGFRSASAMIVMPPMECPTSTIGPSGTTERRIASRSAPSWAIVHERALAWPERPWRRWS